MTPDTACGAEYVLAELKIVESSEDPDDDMIGEPGVLLWFDRYAGPFDRFLLSLDQAETLRDDLERIIAEAEDLDDE